MTSRYGREWDMGGGGEDGIHVRNAEKKKNNNK